MISSYSAILRFIGIQRNRLEVSRRSETLLHRILIFAVPGVATTTIVLGCTTNDNANDRSLADRARESDAESDHWDYFVDDKTILSLLPEQWQKGKTSPFIDDTYI